jgi:hypothetical protein
MCLQCIAKAERLVENAIPGYSLYRATVGAPGWPAGWYGLVECNDPTIVFPRLVADPAIPDGEETDENMVEFDAFIAAADALRDNINLTLNQAGPMYLACIQAGYDDKKHGFVECWLTNHLAIQAASAIPVPHEPE